MPDTPGTGPTDPDEVARFIRMGADLYQGHLRVIRSGEERWLAVVLDDHGLPKWVPTLTRGVGIGAEDFDKLARGRIEDRYVYVDSKKYALVPPKPSAFNQIATLLIQR